jgi:peptidyl-prolyl cis-trans isomerase B (cyclophilin B)
MKTATFETNKGTFMVELYDQDAPGTVANFEKLIRDGYYDGIVFHRVIPDFVVQGGDPITKGPNGLNERGVGSGGPGYTIKDELVGNPRRHELGALSMAHAGPNTGGSQFFIVLSEANTRHLNGVHTVFGKVTQGMEVVNQIRAGDRMERVTVADDAQA